MSNQGRSTYQATLDTASYFQDNTSELITEAKLRDSLTNLSDSTLFKKDDPFLRIVTATTGTEPAYVITLTNLYSGSYSQLMPILFNAHATNTGASTINVNSLGAKSLKRPDGTATQAGDIVSGQLYIINYDGTDFLIVPGFGGGTAFSGWQISGTPSNNQVLTATNSTTAQGEATFTFDGSSSFVDGGGVYARGAANYDNGYSILGSFGGAGITFGLIDSAPTDVATIGIENITDTGSDPIFRIQSGTSLITSRPIFQLRNYTTSVLDVSADGNFDFQDGDLTTTGTITFAAGSGTFFSQGTFTPVLAFGGASVGITYTTQSGIYSKVGNQVNVAIRIVLTNKGSSTGSATITGLPFTSNTNGAYRATGAFGGDNYSSMGANAFTQITANSTIVSFYELNTGSFTTIDDTNFGNTTVVNLSITYITD
jgi:hypothetical protein